MTPIVVTGVGAMTALGHSAQKSWDALVRGETGVRTLTRCPAVPQIIQAAGEIDLTLEPYQDRFEALAVHAAREALEQAGFQHERTPTRRLGIVLGCSSFGLESLFTLATQHAQQPKRISPWLFPAIMSNGPASRLAREYHATAPVFTINTACASGMDAMGLGALLLQSGQADLVLAGGTEAQIVSWIFASGHALRAMATGKHAPACASRPWDAARTGMVLAEGAACVVLERAEDAAGRGLASIEGYQSACEPVAFVIPDVGSVVRCLGAVRDQVTPLAQQGLCVHGSGTVLGDHTEMEAIRHVFGDECAMLHAWGTKGAFGHTLGSGCAIDVVMSIFAVRHGIVPPTRNLRVLDPDAPPVQMSRKAVAHAMESVTTLAMGFGGHHAAMRIGALHHG